MNKTKKKILENSFALFLIKSYNQVTMKDIQEAIGISRGAIYHHFSSKEQIYEDVIKEYLLPAFFSYSTISEEDKGNLEKTINSVIKHRQNHITRLKEITSLKLIEYYFFKFIFQAMEQSSNFREQASLLYEKEFNSWRNTIITAVRSGEVRPDVDIEFTTQWFVNAPLGLGVSTAYSKYVVNSMNVNDLKTTYIKYYNLIKKVNSYR